MGVPDGFLPVGTRPGHHHRHRADLVAAAKEHFHEIYIKASLAACEQRDAKGLYRKARSGEIADFTGVTAHYEMPESPELTIDTDCLTVEESVAVVLEYVERIFRNHLNPAVLRCEPSSRRFPFARLRFPKAIPVTGD
jgi:hypothetical protein